MRTAVLCLIAVGCGKPAPVPVQTRAPVGKIDASDLVRHYTHGDGSAHKWEGKRIEVRLNYEVWGAPDANGRVCLLWESGNGFRRPALIARSANVWKTGTKPTQVSSCTVSGELVGFVPLASRPEFRPWCDLTMSDRYTGDSAVLLDDVLNVPD